MYSIPLVLLAKNMVSENVLRILECPFELCPTMFFKLLKLEKLSYIMSYIFKSNANAIFYYIIKR